MAELSAETESPSPPGLRRGRTVGIVGILTIIVAVVGYLREAALASRFGVSATMDAYFSAIFIPNVLYFVLIAGTFSSIFIPILLQENAAQDRSRASETFSHVTNFVLLLVFATVSCGMLTARKWLPLLFSGFSPATTEVAVHLTYVILPAVLFLAVAGILTAVLHGFHKFALAAFAPALTSAAVIAGVLLARGDNAIYMVGIAIAIGFFLQFLVLIPAAASLGIRYHPVLDLQHPAIRTLLRLGGPLFFYLAAANASSFLERNLASRLSAGAVSTLSYALRLFTVPANFLAAPLATVAYPQFAREAVRDQHGDLSNQVSRIFRLIVFLFLPITIWVILNAMPVTQLLYERGHFTPEDSVVTSRVVMLYGIGILPNAIAIVLLRCFYAVRDTVTPLLAELVDLVYYVITAPLLTARFGLSGLAITRGLSFFVVTAILMFVLSRRRGLLKFDVDLLRFFFRTAAASVLMGLVSWTSFYFLRPAFSSSTTGLRLGIICLVLAVSGSVFLAAALLLKIGEAKQILATVLDLMRITPDRPVSMD